MSTTTATPALSNKALTLSKRALSQKPPATLAMSAKTRALVQQGIDVISFGLGEPDFDTPEPIRRAAIDALNTGQTHYMPTLGDAATRQVIAEKLVKENNIANVTGDNVAISTGAKHSLWLVYQSLLDEHSDCNEALLPVPAWVSYRPMIELCGGRVTELGTTVDTDFKVSPDQLRRAITPRSRMLMLNTPSNPCGTMYTEEELRAIARVVAEAAATVAPQLVIVVDEIYEKICYGGIEHFSIGAVPEVAQRTITINGMSKSFAMTGWRVGYSAAPGEFGKSLAKAIDALQGQQTSCITSFVYPAIRAALTQGAPFSRQFCEAFSKRAKIAYQHLERIPGMRCAKPTGAFYLFPEISSYFGKKTPKGKTINSALDFAEALLAEGHVAVVPGEEFGGCGKNHIRFSFACSEDKINKGMERVAKFVASLA
jgi:aspartate aminotransferase